MSGLPSPDVATTQIATGVSPTPTRYDALTPQARQALRVQQDADPGIRAFLQRTQISTGPLGIAQELIEEFNYGPKQSESDGAAHNNAVVNTQHLMQEGMRRFINENGGPNFNTTDATREATALDDRLHQGIIDAIRRFRTPDEVIANCEDHPDWQEPAKVADRLEGYAAVSLAKGKIASALGAIREAQIRRSMGTEIEAGDWLGVIAEARTPIGVSSASWAFDKRAAAFDSQMKKLGFAFNPSTKTYSKS